MPDTATDHAEEMRIRGRSEPAQRAADAYLELAQFLERLAKDYRERAGHYRAGRLHTAYEHLPADAGDHMRHPCQRAIDAMSPYDVSSTYERLRAELAKPVKVAR
jgi:hypothetical protein